MTKNQFRLLYVGSMAVAFLSVFIDQIFGLLPQDLQEIHNTLLMKESRLGDFSMLLIVIFFVVGLVASFYGTLRFRSWAPRFNLVFSILSLLPLIADGTPSIQSNIAKSLELISGFASTLVLVLPYISENVKQMFWPRDK